MRKHDCKLSHPTQVRIINQVIETGLLINLRRRLHTWCMLSAKHPMSAVYYKSMTSRVNEELRHLANYRWMIHPYSMVALYWEIFFIVVYLVQFVTLAIVSANNVYFRKPSFLVLWKISLDYIMTVDMIKIFLTGYYDPTDNKTVLNKKKIAKMYLRTYFLLDLIVCLHSYLVPIRIIFDAYDEFENKTFLLALTLKSFISLRIFRIKRWLEALELFRLYTNFSSVSYRAFQGVLLFVVLLLYMYIVIFQVEEIIEKNFVPAEYREWTNSLIRSFFSATLMVMHVSYGDNPATHPIKNIFSLCFMAIGYGLQLFLFTLVLQVWVKLHNTGRNNDHLLQQFTEYINYKDLPLSLRNRFFSFYQFKFQNQFYNETQINNAISKLLRQEILVYVTKTHVQRVEFFKDLPDHVLQKMVSQLKSEIYLANDIIIRAGLPGSCMFFIYFGTVAIYTPAGREICHLEDGAHFGEIALIFNEPRVATLVAVTPCELFMLDRRDFLEVLEPFPKIQATIRQLAQERMRTTFVPK